MANISVKGLRAANQRDGDECESENSSVIKSQNCKVERGGGGGVCSSTVMRWMFLSPSRVPSRTLCVGKSILPLVDSKETSGAKTESAAGRSRSRNNLQQNCWSIMAGDILCVYWSDSYLFIFSEIHLS